MKLEQKREEEDKRKMSEYKALSYFHFYQTVQGYLKKELTPAVLSVNAQDVNVPDPPLLIHTAPPCCFKNRTEKERKLI